MAGPLTAQQRGRYLRYGKGQVMADYSLFSHGLLVPLYYADRRLILLMDSGVSNHPKLDSVRLRKLVKDGWKLLPMTRSEGEKNTATQRLPLQGVSVLLRQGLSDEAQKELLRA